MTWLSRLWDRCRQWFSPLRPATLSAALASGPEIPRAAADALLRRAAPAHFARYPAALALLRINGLRDALRRGTAGQFVAGVERLRHEASLAGALDDESWTVAAVRAMLQRAWKAGTIDQAWELFLALRRVSTAYVPESRPVIEELARRRRCDPQSVAAYLEYLTFDGRPSAPQEQAGPVLEALQAACAAPDERGERYNRWAKQIGGFDWASLELMRRYRRARALDLARQEAEFLLARGDGDALRHLEIGLVFRARREWSLAQREFTEAWERAGENSSARRCSHVLRVEAATQATEQELARGAAAEADFVARWQEWDTWLRNLFLLVGTEGGLGEAGPGAGSWTEEECPAAAETLVSIGQRLHEPRKVLATISTIAAGGLAWRWLPEQLWDLLLESGQAGNLAGMCSPAEASLDLTPGCWPLVRWRLFQGRLSRLGPLGAQAREVSPADRLPAGDLLAAEYQLRTGQPHAAQPLLARYGWSQRIFNQTWFELRIDRALAAGQVSEARTMVQGPQAMLLPWLSRELRRAETEAAAGNWSSALETYHALLQREPHAPRALLSLGWFSLSVGRDDPARDCFQRVLQFDPENLYAQVGGALAAGRSPADCAAAEPELGLLMRAWAARLRNAGRHDLVKILAAVWPAECS